MKKLLGLLISLTLTSAISAECLWNKPQRGLGYPKGFELVDSDRCRQELTSRPPMGHESEYQCWCTKIL